ncbi:MAG: oligosaccharide flippase family protein [Clostridia bacterium]|nr:oligosaccharide flippase family protein [Clostridia bacterium]
MNKKKELVKNTVIIALGKISTKFVTFVLLPLYTTILSVEEYGTVELLNTLVSLCLPIVTFQIEQALFRNLIDNRNKEDETRRTITTTFIIVSLQVILYLILFFIISPWIQNEYKYFLIMNVIVCVYSNILLQISRGLGENKKYTIGSMLTAATSIILNIVLIMVFKFGAYGMLTASLIGNIVCGVYIFIAEKIYKYINIKQFSKELLLKLWKYSFPLIPNEISWWIFNSSDRIIVSTTLGIGANGILSAAYKFSSVYITIYNIFNMTWTESAALYIEDKEDKEFFSNVINTVLKLFASMCLGIIAIMPYAFKLIINEKFDEAYNHIPILMVASLFNVIVGLISAIYIAKKDTKSVAKTSIMAAIINLVVNLLFIKWIGLYAASISTLVAYLIMAIYRLHDVKKYIEIKLDKRVMITTIAMILLICIIYYQKNWYWNIIGVLATMIYIWNINKNSIGMIKNMIKGKLKKNES